ncbi:MAG: CAP domain-containing protein [Cryomorphaceae bacterium]|nr:CAP domain-containing protein [Cryomorphaceae bacterium]
MSAPIKLSLVIISIFLLGNSEYGIMENNHISSINFDFKLSELSSNKSRLNSQNNSFNLKDASERIETGIFSGIQSERAKRGLPEFTHDNRLARAAEIHNIEMVKFKFFSHIHPRNKKLQTPKHRVETTGLMEMTVVGENIAKIYGARELFVDDKNMILKSTIDSLADQFVNQWLNSRGHFQNIINPDYVFTGISCYISDQTPRKDEMVFYATQVFMTKPQ